MIELETTEDGFWRATLNRPDKANSVTRAMLGELAEIAERAHGVAKVFVLTGRWFGSIR